MRKQRTKNLEIPKPELRSIKFLKFIKPKVDVFGMKKERVGNGGIGSLKKSASDERSITTESIKLSIKSRD